MVSFLQPQFGCGASLVLFADSQAWTMFWCWVLENFQSQGIHNRVTHFNAANQQQEQHGEDRKIYLHGLLPPDVWVPMAASIPYKLRAKSARASLCACIVSL